MAVSGKDYAVCLNNGTTVQHLSVQVEFELSGAVSFYNLDGQLIRRYGPIGYQWIDPFTKLTPREGYGKP